MRSGCGWPKPALEHRNGGTGDRTCPNGRGGTVREDYSADGDAWSFFPHEHARSRVYRWNEDRRHGRVQRRDAELVPGARCVEWRRSDSEGADVRADRATGQPRRVRQGILVVPGRHPDPFLEHLALPLPAAGIPLHRPGRRERPPGQAGTRIRVGRHRCIRRCPVLGGHRRLCQGRPAGSADADHRGERGAGRGDPACAAHVVVPQHVVVGVFRSPEAEPAAGR